MAKNLVESSTAKIIENNNDISIQVNFPIGYIYMSTTSTNPSTYFGGTWQRIALGKTLVGVDEEDEDFETPKLIGGEKEHKLTYDELPSQVVTGYCASGHESWSTGKWGDNSSGGYPTNVIAYSGQGTGGQSHNIMQPYFTCYIWEKVGN